MKAIRLRCEYLINPIGVELKSPRLMWNTIDGIKQTAYQIITEKWDSGKILTDSMHADYPLPLRSRERVTWRIRLWDENDFPGEWNEAFFEIGLLSENDWSAKWITGDYIPNKKTRYPVDCFRKAFSVRHAVRQARLYVSACGLYEAKLNGKKVGEFVLAPGLTDYRKRVQYQTIDVTAMLDSGENELTAQLADGWYRGSVGARGLTYQYGTETKFLCQLEIEYTNGIRERIVSDQSWQWSNDGPIRFADNKDGEIVEAYRIPTYHGLAKETRHTVLPTASNSVPATEHEHFHPVITVSPNGKKLLDFGQNIAGYLSFRIEANRGQRMLWRFGEMLDKQGNLTLKNIQCAYHKKLSPLQQIDFTSKEGMNSYKTTFAVFGFRYAEVDTEVELRPESIEAIAIYSDLAETGRFESSNELLNRFVKATQWSTKSNSLDIPTDCPTRERHGWTGDVQIFFNTASYLFDYAAFSKKYLRDIYDWQRKNGCLPQIAPDGGVDFFMWTMNGSVGWADIGILLPYRFWKKYGDSRVLDEYYERMKKYAGFMMRRISSDGIVRKGQSYGEWAEPADVQPYDWKDLVLPHSEVSTAYTSYVLRCLSEIAEALNRHEDAELYRSVSAKCKAAYQNKYGTNLDTDRQAQLVRPLAFDLLNEQQKTFAKRRLLEALDHYGWRIGTGFLSTPLILDVLAEIDLEKAYRLLENEEMPGWLFMPKAGATTIWEGWEGTEGQGGVASLNHYSKGAVVEWLFKAMCGIRMDGENHFTIAPRPGGHFTSAKASYDSIYGTVESGWEMKGDQWLFTVTVPANCSATVILDGQSQEFSTGTYHFEGNHA